MSDVYLRESARRIAETVRKKGRAYAMKYLIHCAKWSEFEARKIVEIAQKDNEGEEKPPA